MSLQFSTLEFRECPTCAAKPGSPSLCKECLERRELIDAILEAKRTGFAARFTQFNVCKRCNGVPNPECPEHGR